MEKNDLLIIFTKNPELGKVKTRLARSIGDEKALMVYRNLLDHTHKITAPLKVHKRIYYSHNIAENDIWEKGDFEKKLQCEGDLGHRMMKAVNEGFDDGFKKVIIMGSDLFDISTKEIVEAFKKLDTSEYVIGPALDGGYYLLGLKVVTSSIFQNKEWSTSSVYRDTIADMQEGNIEVLDQKNDIDTLEDLEHHPELIKIISNDR